MSIRITEFTFLDQFASNYNIPVPRYIAGTKEIAEITEALEEWGGEAIIKPDVLSGKRGKAGAIVRINNINDAVKEIKRISGLEIGGNMTRIAYLVEPVPADLEMYSAITYNSKFLGPSLTMSLSGGMDIESVPEDKKITIPINIFEGLDAYQVSDALAKINCPQKLISKLSRAMINFWDLFITSGMQMAEINPWRITSDGTVFACDFKAVIDEANYKAKSPGAVFPVYPKSTTSFEESMIKWSAASHQGQAHVSDLGGTRILPILFGGGASTIITETLEIAGGSPVFLSDFGGNPPYERMLGTARRCFNYNLDKVELLLILGGKANNTFIDVTFQAIADALIAYTEEKGTVNIPVVIGRGGPRLVKGLLAMRQALDYLKLPYVIFGPDTPVTLVADYAAKLVNASIALKEGKR